jgi:hypothetical protein
MMAQCVTLVISNQYLVFAGNVLNVQIMICVRFVTIVTNTIFVIAFSASTPLEVKGLICTFTISFYVFYGMLCVMPADVLLVVFQQLFTEEFVQSTRIINGCVCLIL